ncbi:MAG: TolC family protein [Verrucomicrobiota bacterium]
MDRALKQNADVLVAKKRVEAAAGMIIEARAGYLPSLTTSANYEYLESDYSTLAGANPNNRPFIWNIYLRLTENVYAGGATRGKLDIARLQKQSRLLDYQTIVDRVIQDVRIAFYDILRIRADIIVHEQAIAFLRQQENNERNRLELGTGQKLNVMRAAVNLAFEEAALVDSRNRLRNSRLQLSELLAIPVTTDDGDVPFDITGELKREAAPPPITDCLTRAMTQRPELAARDNDVTVQRRQLTVDRSELLPHLEIFTGYDIVSEPNRAALVDSYDGYVAGVQISWHIFDGLVTKGRLNATRARLSEAETGAIAMRRTVQAEVLRAYRDIQCADEQLQTQTANVKLAEESLKLATSNLELGLSSQLELLQSRLDFTRAQTAELSARFDYNAALARLQRALGSHFSIYSAKSSQ